MPPSRRPDRVTDARNAKPPWNGYRVAFGCPYLLGWNEHVQDLDNAAAPVVRGPPHPVIRNRMQKAEPVGFRRAIPVPIKARMVREDLNARPDDEEHEEHIEEVLDPQPQREAAVNRRRRLGYARIARDELMKPGGRVQTLADRDPKDQNDERDRYDPQDVDPSLAQPDSGHLAPLRRQPAARRYAAARLGQTCFEGIPLSWTLMRFHRRDLMERIGRLANPLTLGGSDCRRGHLRLLLGLSSQQKVPQRDGVVV